MIYTGGGRERGRGGGREGGREEGGRKGIRREGRTEGRGGSCSINRSSHVHVHVKECSILTGREEGDKGNCLCLRQNSKSVASYHPYNAPYSRFWFLFFFVTARSLPKYKYHTCECHIK